MPYKVEFKNSAAAELRALPRSVQKRVGLKLLKLENNPRPSGCKKLKGVDELYRIRIGDYRVIYQINDSVRLVMVAKVADRKEAYD